MNKKKSSKRQKGIILILLGMITVALVLVLTVSIIGTVRAKRNINNATVAEATIDIHTGEPRITEDCALCREKAFKEASIRTAVISGITLAVLFVDIFYLSRKKQ